MPTWVRNDTGTLPTVTNGNLVGTIELDNATAPGDFDPDAVNSVRIEWTIDILSGSFVSPERQTVRDTCALTLNGDGTEVATPVDPGGVVDLNSSVSTVSMDGTDSSIATGFTNAQWEAMELNEIDSGNAAYTVFDQDMGPDGVQIGHVTGIVVTIDYNAAAPPSDGGPSSPTLLDGGSDNTPSSSQATASITPSGNALVLAAVNSHHNTLAPNTPTASGNGLTWVVVRSFLWDDAGEQRRLTLFRALRAAPTAGVLTFDFGGQTQETFTWSVVEFSPVVTTGTDGSGAVEQDVQDPASPAGATAIAAVLAAFQNSANATYGVAVKESAEDAELTGDGNMIDLHDEQDVDDDVRMISQWKDGEETTVDWSWTTTRRAAGFAIEIVGLVPLPPMLESGLEVIAPEAFHEFVTPPLGELGAIDLTLLSSTVFPSITVADSSFQLTHLASTVLYSIFLDGEILLTHLNSTVIHSPTLTSTIDLAHLNSTVFPSPQLDGNIDLAHLNSTAFPLPTVISVLDLATLSSTAFPSIFLDGNIDLALLSSTVIHSPQLDGEILLTTFSSTTFFSIFLDGNIDLTHLNSTVIHSPQLDGEILLTNLSSTIFYSITVQTPAPDPLDMDLLSSTAFPTMLLVSVLDLTHLSSTSLFAMQLDGNIDLAHLSSTVIPSITVGDASIDLTHLSTTTIPSIFIDGNIDLTLLSNTIVFTINVADSSIDLTLLSSTVIYPITVIDPAASAVGIQLPMRGVDR